MGPGVGALLTETLSWRALFAGQIPGGVLLEPNSGLTMNDFTAGVEFFKTLPSIDDPFALRGPAFDIPASVDADTWLGDHVRHGTSLLTLTGRVVRPGALRTRCGPHMRSSLTNSQVQEV